MYSTKAAIDNIMAMGLAVPGTALKRMHVHERYMVMALEAAKLRAHITTDCHEPETCGKTVCCDGVDDRNIIVDRLATVIQTCATRSMSEAFKFANVEEPTDARVASDQTDAQMRNRMHKAMEMGRKLGLVPRGIPTLSVWAMNATVIIDSAIAGCQMSAAEMAALAHKFGAEVADISNPSQGHARTRQALRINMENLMNAAVTEYCQNRHHQGEDDAA